MDTETLYEQILFREIVELWMPVPNNTCRFDLSLKKIKK